MRALVVGGDGNLGRALCAALLARGHEVVRTTRRRTHDGEPGWVYLDLTVKMELPPEIIDATLDVIYVMAAVTGILRCEEDPSAWLVNAEAPAGIARIAERRGWRVVSMSSGTVERAQHTASARQKSYADLGVLMAGGCVVRPLPHVPPEKYVEMADLLVDVGEQAQTGVVRWEG